MSPAETAIQPLTFGSIGRWIALGWQCLSKSPAVSLFYASLYVILGMAFQWGLHATGYTLLHYLFAGGFLLLLPPLLVVYYQIIDNQTEGKKVSMATLGQAFRNTPKTVFGLAVITGILYFIWITDALIIYTVYFALDPIHFGSYAQDLQLRLDTQEFLFHVSLLGLLLALIAFFITAFAVPKAFYEKSSFVDAIVYSIKTIIHNFKVMILWAAIVGGVQLFALLFFPPLELVLLPLFAYANYYAFQDTLTA
ncbi:MAG: hypothetical protein C0631_12100 [Sedimenticola sp.]|jgi:uncharacterized membrane protein|nr:MAG: hypothetical protein C0631_12100 [Sedimenticola sp.]